MATVTSSKRHLLVTSDTYTSNGDVTVGGDLTINGTTTTIDTANLLVEDKNIIIGNVSSPTDTTANGGGITLKGASDYTINWSNANNRWEFNQGIHSTGSITGSNLSGTNTGDQDLSGYATLTGTNSFSGSNRFNTATNNTPVEISRSGSTSSQVLKIGVTDIVATFNYIEDTSSEGNGNFGQYQFKLGGNDGESTVTALTITKTGISAPNFSGSSSGTNTGDQDLSGYALISHNHDDRYYTESESDSRFVNVTGDTMSGNLTLSYAYPRINLYDTNNDSDYSIINNDGSFSIYDITNSSHRFSIAPGGNATFAGSVTAQSAVLSGSGDAMLTLNQTGTDTGWSYINFQTSNVRNYYVGQDNSKNFNIYNDNIDVIAISVGFANANVTLGADLTVSGGDITLGSTGRIQGIDTVSADTDAANKLYVDNAVAGVSYTHPTHPGDDINLDTGALTGATVISDLDFNVTTDTLGHVTDANATYLTRSLTASDIGAASSSHTHSASDITSGTLDTARLPEFIEERYIYNSNDNNGVFMPMVKGGMYATTSSSVTGAIKVTLPSYKSGMMFTIYVDIYEYTAGETVTFRVSGYAYGDSGATWHNCSVVNLSDNTDRNYTVRFYSDTTVNEQYFTIGESNSTWSYPQVNLRDFWGGYSTSESDALGEWDVEFVTNLTGVLRHTFTDNFVAADWDRIRDKPSTFTPSSHNHDSDYVNVTGDTMSGPLVIDEADTTDKWLFRVDNNGSNFSGFWSASQDIQLYLRNQAGNVQVHLKPDARSLFADGLEASSLYDINDTAYYLNPSSTSTALNVAGDARVKSLYIGNSSGQISNRVWFDNGSTNWPGLYFEGGQPKFIIYSSVSNIFHDTYHPNADTWTTARTITLGGDLTGSVSIDGSGDVTLSAQVTNNSHQHNALYENSTITYGASQLQWMDINGNGGTGLNGSNPQNPTNDWHYHMLMNHANSNGYYVDLAFDFHDDNVWFQRNEAGTLQGWRQMFHDGYHPNADTWTTARTITIGNTGKSVNGSANVSWSLAEIGAASSSHTHTWADISGETANSVNGWGGLRHQTNDGYIDFGPANTSHAHIYTDRADFYLNKGIQISGGSQLNASDVRSAIFYDSNNTAYYVDPASTSVLNTLNTNGGDITATHFGIANTSSGTRDGIALYGGAAAGEPTYGLLFTGTSLGTHGGVTGDWATYFTMNNDTSRGWIFRRAGSGNSASISAGGLATFDNSVRTPVFYDSNNTSYYLDPASTSNLQELEILRNSSNYTVNLTDAHDRAGLMIKSSTNFDSKLAFSSGADSRQYIQALNNDHTTGRDIAINPYGGNVAIGKEAPAEALDVDGSITSNATIWTGFDSGVTNSVSCSNWFRSSGSSGWFNSTYSGGIYMVDSTWVRVYNNKKFYADNTIESNSGMYAPIFYDRDNTNYRFNGDASKDGVDLTTSGNYAVHVLGTISGGHRKHGNLETPEMEWSVGGGTDLNWKKLCDVVISDASYSGWGAEIEITNFSGNFGNATYSGGELFKGALSIYHWGGTGDTTETAYANIPYDMRSHVRWYKINETGQNRYQLQVKSPANYQQLYIKVKPGIGNQIADIISYANDTNGSTSGGTAYASIQNADFNHEFAGGIRVNDGRAIGWKSAYGSPYFQTYYGSITTSTSVYIGGPSGNGQDLYCDDLRSNKVYDRAATNYYFEGGNTGDSIRVAGDVVAYYSSDKRLKDNIKPIENALDKVNAISGVTFEWNEKSHKTTGRKDVGVIAQEVEEVFPEIVETRSNGYKAVDYQKLTAVLIESVKELTAKVEALESKQCNCK